MSATFEPVETRDRDGREQRIYRFGNDYGASVIRCNGAPGTELAWFDVAVLRWVGKTFVPDFTTPISASVLDALTEDEVQEALAQINALHRRTPRGDVRVAGGRNAVDGGSS